MSEENDNQEKEDFEVNKEVLELEKKQILLVRVDDRFSASDVTSMIQGIGKTINQENQFTNPVLFVDKSVELEKVSISELEGILKHAKSLVESGKDAQEEVEAENIDENAADDMGDQKHEFDPDQLPEELKDLVPQELRDDINNGL